MVAAPPLTPSTWDVFCRVIDNHGDLGVCWRLAAELAARGVTVRLWVDDATALTWMAPQGAPGVTVLDWSICETASPEPGKVVIEAFGCDPPAAFVARMARQPVPAIWINLEYLSAEPFVARSHRLASPQNSGPGKGLVKWFFYPGFTPDTGGLIREQGFDRNLATWDTEHAAQTQSASLTVTLFCYAPVALSSLIEALATGSPPRMGAPSHRRTRLQVTPGWATREVSRHLRLSKPAAAGQHLQTGHLRIDFLPHLDQAEFDRLLRASDVNFVRGEDSLVRAIWARKPFVWHIYPQDDDAHHRKLAAFLKVHLGAMTNLEPLEAADLVALQRIWWAWNGVGSAPSSAEWHTFLGQSESTWAQLFRCASEQVRSGPELTTALLQFVDERARVRA